MSLVPILLLAACAGGADAGGGDDDPGSDADAAFFDGGGGGCTADCELGCVDGACATETSCTPGAHACFGDSVGVCSASGTSWLHEATCPDGCAAGLCTGACEPAARRCNDEVAERCDADGAGWSEVEACDDGCELGVCVLDRLDVSADLEVDGLVIVDGPVTVFAGATLSAAGGTLDLRAQSITVDAGGAIVVAPVAQGTPSDGRSGYCSPYGYTTGSGGGHAQVGGYGQLSSCYVPGGLVSGDRRTSVLEPGGAGGIRIAGGCTGGAGGGMITLRAPTVTIAGAVHADGGAPTSQYCGGGAGGSILLTGDALAVTGMLSTAGHVVVESYGGGAGGRGYVKLLWGTSLAVTGTIVGETFDSLAPPLDLGSLSHPEPTRFYNDDFSELAVTWSVPFPTRQAYYWQRDAMPVAPPTAATGTLALGEAITIDRDQLVAGANVVHVSTLDAGTELGGAEATFPVQLNVEPPVLASPTHPDPATWSGNHDPMVTWTLPHGDASYRGVHYVLDHFGTTIPTSDDAFVPVTQHQVLHAGVADGLWALHVISIDTVGNPTRAAAHRVLRIGPDPGIGHVRGAVTGPAGAIADATVTFNRGLVPDVHASSAGVYDLTTLPAGTWEITVSAPGLSSRTHTVTVAAGATVTRDFALTP